MDALKGSEKEKLIMETLGLLILADEVFFTGTGAEIVPENEIDK